MLTISFTHTEETIFERIALEADALGVSCYVIGGFVRDKILNRPTNDVDIVCVGDGIQLAENVASQFPDATKVSVFKHFGTAHFRYKNIDIEFVGARKESYRENSRNPAVTPGSLQDDQRRRDLTINALAISLCAHNYGELLDPFNGLGDLEKKILRTPLPPGQTFIDDPLRMLRTIRFAAQLGFSIEASTYEALKSNAERISIITIERIHDELQKMIMAPKPSIAFAHMHETGLLPYFFPSLTDLAGAEYIDGKGHKDNFYHTLQVLDYLADKSNNRWLRWAALLHDIGKPATKRFEQGTGWTFHGHEWVGAQMIPSIFKSLRLPLNEPMKYVQKLVMLHLRPISLTKENITDSAVRRLLFDAGEAIDDLMLLCQSDITSKNAAKVKRFRENLLFVEERMRDVESKDHLRNWQPPISGEIIMKTFGLKPCPEVGTIKVAVREAILDGQIPNQYEAAFAFMLEKGKELHLTPVL